MIPLYKPYMPEVPLIEEILHSGQLSYGKYGKEFETALAEYFNVPNVLTTNTFSNAILVALIAFGLKAGDKVIVSPMACLASTQPLLTIGLKVLWADVHPKTGTLEPDSVRSLVKNNPKAIIHNHFCGYVGFIDEINSIGKEFGIPVIDDGIEAFGSEYKGEKVGNVGTDVTVFSFSPVRIPNTLDGGAVIFKDANLYNKSLLLRDSGIDRSRFRNELGEINPGCDIEHIGFSATPCEINSYIGIQQMKNVNRNISIQRKNALNWDRKLNNNSEIIPVRNEPNFPNYWVFGTLVKNKNDSIIKYRKSGYYASGVHINNNIYSVFGNSSYLPGVSDFYNNFVALPCGWWIGDDSL